MNKSLKNKRYGKLKLLQQELNRRGMNLLSKLTVEELKALRDEYRAKNDNGTVMLIVAELEKRW